ncbi:hypothetical protein [Sinosporangium siamense]|uniref:Uncharacterized protein n=1 Tax=Sinosporangium siamense TaxID=1367973 RepID=A0A919RP46_9ACTN|nr:hypothetical protein [Sinosporangium siamense]GII97342.1 hypothetical protein Ssi02_75730 [Sinosporangium siamense]
MEVPLKILPSAWASDTTDWPGRTHRVLPGVPFFQMFNAPLRLPYFGTLPM